MFPIVIYLFRYQSFKNLESAGRIDIDLKCSSAVGKSTLGIGLILACFHAFGIITVRFPDTVVNNCGQRSNYGIRNKFDKFDGNYDVGAC